MLSYADRFRFRNDPQTIGRLHIALLMAAAVVAVPDDAEDETHAYLRKVAIRDPRTIDQLLDTFFTRPELTEEAVDFKARDTVSETAADVALQPLAETHLAEAVVSFDAQTKADKAEAKKRADEAEAAALEVASKATPVVP